MQFFKYHALGNDYIVLDPEDGWSSLEPEQIRRICHRNYGIGSDGILLGPFENPDCDFGLRIFNPDGSEAEKSGNGLRIFSRFLHDEGRVGDVPFSVMTAGGPVTCRIHSDSSQVTVDMGTVSFHSEAIPVAGPPREVLDETMEIQGETFLFCAATVGNPHCVIPRMRISKAETCRLGPLIETVALFPRRTNVQFMQVLDRESIAIEIWERGAGYTLASGSSSTAAAAVAYRLGLCDADILVRMPGGTIEISLTKDFHATMAGPVTPVGSGNLHREMFAWPIPV